MTRPMCAHQTQWFVKLKTNVYPRDAIVRDCFHISRKRLYPEFLMGRGNYVFIVHSCLLRIVRYRARVYPLRGSVRYRLHICLLLNH